MEGKDYNNLRELLENTLMDLERDRTGFFPGHHQKLILKNVSDEILVSDIVTSAKIIQRKKYTD